MAPPADKEGRVGPVLIGQEELRGQDHFYKVIQFCLLTDCILKKGDENAVLEL
jgi:hypothetical protein